MDWSAEAFSSCRGPEGRAANYQATMRASLQQKGSGGMYGLLSMLRLRLGVGEGGMSRAKGP